jgi:hypothetical protein
VFVLQVIGKCPGCGTSQAFGNVSVFRNTLRRGCSYCDYSERFPLPKLSKEVLYLDQFFLSHAFRAELPEFVDATKLIGELAHAQLLVCPYSSVHEVETHQWRHSQQQHLWEFIKRTLRGRKLSPAYRVRHTQIARGFERFLTAAETPFPIEARDALPRELNDWDNYLRFGVRRAFDNIELTRHLKQLAVDQLIGTFSDWRKDTTTFEEDRYLESQATARDYIHLYLMKIARIAQGDVTAAFDSPIDTRIVAGLMSRDRDALDHTERLGRIVAYFKSPHFLEVPCEWISAGLFAVLKNRVKQGQYQNLDKAKERLSGFPYDVQFISAYAPYCQAMFVDRAMYEFVNDKRLALTKKFGTRFFSRSNWSDFVRYLESIKAKKTAEIQHALDMVHPR